MADLTSKTCTSCKKTLPIEAFGIARNNPDGFQYHCRDCCREVQRKSIAKRKEMPPERECFSNALASQFLKTMSAVNL